MFVCVCVCVHAFVCVCACACMHAYHVHSQAQYRLHGDEKSRNVECLKEDLSSFFTIPPRV